MKGAVERPLPESKVMANPASITITELSANSQNARPAGQTIDTTGMVPVNADGKGFDRILIEVTNGSANNLTVSIAAADKPPGLQSKSLTGAALAQNAVAYLGPFSSSQFSKAGKLEVTFTPATGSPSATVRCYRLPKFV